MADYKKMYNQLFNDVTTAIELLQNAQIKTEETYITAVDAPISLLDGGKKETEDEQ